MIRCVAVDDEPLALNIIREYISKIPELELVQVFDDPISAAGFLRNAKIDLLFLDINMPDIGGLELVRSLDKRPMLIFTTAHKKFAFDGFELEAIDYLLKPTEFKRFSRAIHKAIEWKQNPGATFNDEGQNLFVHSEYRLLKIPFRDIEYIESLEDYIKIHLTNGKPVLTLMSLKKVLEKLPSTKFRRIHRSYIVATDKVESILNRKVQLPSTELPVSDSYVNFISDWQKN
ncbi:MAG: DNA-binding response regulator [Bacteroidetes bacterium]|nr:MAG: DNA-binding response regulator [Bacteroidota bacterium]